MSDYLSGTQLETAAENHVHQCIDVANNNKNISSHLFATEITLTVIPRDKPSRAKLWNLNKSAIEVEKYNNKSVTKIVDTSNKLHNI